MIEITPDIIGPGIEEEYADAQAAIDDVRVALGPRPLTNHTPEGRVLLEVGWVEREIEARRLPIPVGNNWIRTILYIVGSNDLGGVPGCQEALGRLSLVLQGEGLMKQRHVPVLIAMMDEYLADADPVRPELPASDVEILHQIRAKAADLRRGGAWRDHRRPQDQWSARSSARLDGLRPHNYERLSAIGRSLSEGWRPPAARKPPLAAPVPGLPDSPPPLPPELEGTLP